ncbi:MAG: hypothetical protein MI717_05585, partial [Spirochaetales bacterium]|nr:hypothetical protein [Spirochaetales bacterium]
IIVYLSVAYHMCVCVVVGVEIITLYQVQTGRFLATTGYVAPSPNHVQHNVQKGDHSVSQRVVSAKEKKTHSKTP